MISKFSKNSCLKKQLITEFFCFSGSKNSEIRSKKKKQLTYVLNHFFLCSSLALLGAASGIGSTFNYSSVISIIPAAIISLYILSKVSTGQFLSKSIKHTVILEYFNLKQKALLILPSSLNRYSSAPKTKRIFQMLWCIFEGCTTGHGHPSSFWKIAKLALFDPCM